MAIQTIRVSIAVNSPTHCQFMLAGLLLLAASWYASVAQATAREPSVGEVTAAVIITDARVYEMPPGQANAAVYFNLKNVGDQAIRLTAVQTSAAKMVMLHGHEVENGIARMRHREHVHLSVGQTVSFQPGGLHVMLMNLTQPLEVGQTLSLTLKFADGTCYSFPVPVVSR